MLAEALVRTLFDVVWPQSCPLCDTIVGRTSDALCDGHRTLLHASCLDGLRRWKPSPARPRPRARGVPVRALLVDDAKFFAALHVAKYGGRPSLLRLLAGQLANAASQAGWVTQEFVVTPVPDDPRRRRERGFGPAEILAREVARRTGARFRADLVRRRRPAPSLASVQGAGRRRDHQRDLWGIARLAEIERVTPIALVDDQLTTGSTAAALVRLLGARGNPLLVLSLASSSAAPGEV